MGAIFYRQFSTGSAPYLTLAGEEYVRPLGIGSDWTTLRVALLCAVTPNGVSNILNLTSFFGLCSGNQGFASSGCLNAIGDYAADLTSAYTSNGGQNFHFISGATGAKEVAGIITAGSGVNYTLPIIGKRAVLLMTVAKGSPNWSISLSEVSSAAGGNFATDQQTRHAIEWCDTTSTSAPVIILDGTTITYTGATASIAFSEVAGPIDSLNLYWNKAQFPLEIYGIFIARQA